MKERHWWLTIFLVILTVVAAGTVFAVVKVHDQADQIQDHDLADARARAKLELLQCQRVQVLRDGLNENTIADYRAALSAARVIRLAHVPGAGRDLRTFARIAGSTLYYPPVDCSKVIQQDGAYKPPAPIPIHQYMKGAP